MANLIASGTAEAFSADFTLTAGQSTTLSLSAAQPLVPLPRQVAASIQLKGSNGAYNPIGEISGQNPQTVLTAIGTFRVQAFASPIARLVDRD